MSSGLTIDVSSDLAFELSCASALCEVLDTPRALTVFMLIKHEMWRELLDLKVDPLHYQDHSNFADDYLATSLLQKSANLPTGIDLHKAALDAFYASEDSCRRVNDKLISTLTGGLPPLIERARSIIHKVLGPLTREDLDFVEASFRFGPGATTGVPGTGSVVSDKFDEEIHLTQSLVPYYKAILGQTWWESKTRPVVVEGNRFTSVPKNAKTNRGICVEPTLNIFVQLGIGQLLRRRLKRLGIDLSDQTKNQSLARMAYREKLATIDLSAASDSLAYLTVIRLLPEPWVELLEIARSPTTLVDGKIVNLEKYSSMGNGFTFELETLIFAAIAHAACSGDTSRVAVYGDDIIVPQKHAPLVIDALDFLGFSVNLKKTFLAGRFFESCGTDWFNSQPVRPFFLRKSKESKLPYTMQTANSLRRYAQLRLNGLGCDSRFRSLWVSLMTLTPEPWKSCKVPLSLGDVGLIVSEQEARMKRRPRNQLEGWVVRTVSLTTVRKRKRTIGRLLAALACGSPEPTYGMEPDRKSVV